jgi:hypothetical protein
MATFAAGFQDSLECTPNRTLLNHLALLFPSDQQLQEKSERCESKIAVPLWQFAAFTHNQLNKISRHRFRSKMSPYPETHLRPSKMKSQEGRCQSATQHLASQLRIQKCGRYF